MSEVWLADTVCRDSTAARPLWRYQVSAVTPSGDALPSGAVSDTVYRLWEIVDDEEPLLLANIARTYTGYWQPYPDLEQTFGWYLDGRLGCALLDNARRAACYGLTYDSLLNEFGLVTHDYAATLVNLPPSTGLTFVAIGTGTDPTLLRLAPGQDLLCFYRAPNAIRCRRLPWRTGAVPYQEPYFEAEQDLGFLATAIGGAYLMDDGQPCLTYVDMAGVVQMIVSADGGATWQAA